MAEVVNRLSGATWTSLRAFVAVHRSGSIAAAADELGMATASISGQISALERRLGCQLFERTNTGMLLTDRGRDLAARLTGPVEALASAVGAFALDDPPPGSVLLAGPAEFLSLVVLPTLLERLPASLRLTARFGLADDLIEALRRGQVDVLVSAVPPRRPGLTYAPLVDEHFVLVGQRRWHGRDAEELDSIPLLAYDAELAIIRRYWRSALGRRPTMRPYVIVPDLRVIAQLAVQGLGMSVLPDYLVRPYLESGELVLLHEPEIAPLNTLYLATRRSLVGSDADAVRDLIHAACRASKR